MTTVVLSNVADTDADCIQINIHVEAKILKAEKARRKANVWLLMNIGNLLGARNPELILVNDQLIWRYDIIVTSPTRGTIGIVGRIEVDAITGEILADEETLDKDVQERANALVGP